MSKKVYRMYKDCHKTIDEIVYKQCMDCLEWFIMNGNYFKVQPSQRDGHSERCIPCQKLYNHNTYMKNQEINLAKAKEYRLEHLDEIKEYKKKYRKENKEKIRSDNTNPKYRALKKRLLDKWKSTEEGKQKIRGYSQNRRQKDHRITNQEWESCKSYFAHRCAYCGLPIEEHYIPRAGQMIWIDLHKEHLIDTGKDNLSNCIPSCQSCNSEKRNYTLNYWYNPTNPKYDYERYYKIYMWIRYDYKKYIVKRKPKGKYERKNK